MQLRASSDAAPAMARAREVRPGRNLELVFVGGVFTGI
jgi:hypothetical protein